MKRLTLFALFCILLVGCFPETSSPALLAPMTQPTRPISNDSIQVKAWTDNPTPASGERVIVYGSLIKHNVWLDGIMMQATWADASHEPGTPNCFVLVTYGRGVCAVDTGAFPSGVYVPVEIEFDYRGATYRGSTGFTPR